jgi:hypothetical protein
MFRISTGMDWPIADVDTEEEIEPVIRASEPGRYHVDEIGTNPLAPGRTSRRWGIAIRHPDGSVVLLPDPRP